MKKVMSFIILIMVIFYGCNNEKVIILKSKKSYPIKIGAPVMVKDSTIGEVKELRKKDDYYYIGTVVNTKKYVLREGSEFFVVMDKKYKGYVVKVIPSDSGKVLENGAIVEYKGSMGYFSNTLKGIIKTGIKALKNRKEWKYLSSYVDSIRKWSKTMKKEEMIEKLKSLTDSLDIDIEFLKEYVDSIVDK